MKDIEINFLEDLMSKSNVTGIETKNVNVEEVDNDDLDLLNDGEDLLKDIE